MSEANKNFQRLLITWFQNRYGFCVDKVKPISGGYVFYTTDEDADPVYLESEDVFDGMFTDDVLVDYIYDAYSDSLAQLNGIMPPDDFAEAFTNIVGMDIDDEDFDRYITWYESGDHGLNDYDFLKVLQDIVDLDTQIKLFLEDVGC